MTRPKLEFRYLACYEGDRFVESMRYVRAYPAELPLLAEMLPQITTPVEIIGGLWDWAVPPSNHRYLHERLSEEVVRAAVARSDDEPLG